VNNKNNLMVKFTKNKKVYEENINNLPARAQAVIFPDSIQEISNIIKLSSKETDIISRGFGISFSAASVPLEKNNSIIIDFSKMKEILELNLSNKTIVVQPGVLVSDLNEELFKYNLEFPVIPMFQGLETIGSMIAKNSGGSREVKYNRIINWLESIEIINSKGEKIRISKSDLSDYCGMEGTTGIITRATLRLTTKKKRTLTILKSENLKDIFIANKRLRMKMDVCSIDFFNKEISALLGLDKKYHLFIEFDSEEGMFKEEDYEKFMKLKAKAYKRIAGEGFYLLDSLKLFSETIEDYFIYLEEKKIPYFAFLASGVVFLSSRNDEKDKNKIFEALLFGAKLKAKISPNLGYGFTRKDFLEKGEANLLMRVKARHDANCKFNRDKFLECLKKLEKQEEKEEMYKKIEEIKGVQTSEALKEDYKIITEEKPEEVEKLNNEEEQTALTKPEQNEIRVNDKQDELKINEKDKKPEQQTPNAQDLINQAETFTLRKPDELTKEQKEQIKKIASGFFGGNEKNP
jgi:FAD/FMN-containing dehydrogenase